MPNEVNAIRILLVEDDAALAKALVRGLTDEGYLVDHAADADTAQSFVRARNYAVIVLDRRLPGRRGEHLLADWRRAGVETSVLILSALDTVEERVLGLRAGADDYLVKPFAFAELLARVDALGRRGATPGRGLWLEPAKLTAHRGERRVELREKEFRILACLHRQAGNILSRDMLRNLVWSSPEDVNDNTIEVHVRNLRQKLAELGEGVVIETVRGVGYRLVLPS